MMISTRWGTKAAKMPGQFEMVKREAGGQWHQQKVGFRLSELNLSDLAQVPVPVPSLQEQRVIVSRLASLQEQLSTLRDHQQRAKEELDALLPAVLDSAFRGLL
jgi:hypothetical protein